MTNDHTNPERDANAPEPSESANYVVTGNAQPIDSANSGGVRSVEFGTCAEPVGLSTSVVAWTPAVDTDQQDTDGETGNTLSQLGICVDETALVETTSDLKSNTSIHSITGVESCNPRLNLRQPSGHGSRTIRSAETDPHRRNRVT